MTIGKNCDILYLNNNPNIEQLQEMLMTRKDLIVSRYPNIAQISRKDVFQRIMTVAEYFSEENNFDFIPRTFVIPQDL